MKPLNITHVLLGKFLKLMILQMTIRIWQINHRILVLVAELIAYVSGGCVLKGTSSVQHTLLIYNSLNRFYFCNFDRCLSMAKYAERRSAKYC